MEIASSGKIVRQNQRFEAGCKHVADDNENYILRIVVS